MRSRSASSLIRGKNCSHHLKLLRLFCNPHTYSRNVIVIAIVDTRTQAFVKLNGPLIRNVSNSIYNVIYIWLKRCTVSRFKNKYNSLILFIHLNTNTHITTTSTSQLLVNSLAHIMYLYADS